MITNEETEVLTTKVSGAHEEKHKSLDYVNKLSSLNLFIYWIITRGA